ncbi:MAG: DinB family protein [Bacteroidota bacterium]
MLENLQSAATYFLDWNLERITRCLDELTETQVWERPNGNSNSVGNQILHLEGNIRQWAVHGLGGATDVRTREAEFAATGGSDKKVLLGKLTAVIQEAKSAVAGLTPEEMMRERPVQAYVHDGTFILLHVIEHLSYHTGQIIFWTKALKDVNLDFYGGDDLNAKH